MVMVGWVRVWPSISDSEALPDTKDMFLPSRLSCAGDGLKDRPGAVEGGATAFYRKAGYLAWIGTS